MTGPGRQHPEDGEPGPISPSFGPFSTSPEPAPDLQTLSDKKQLSLQTADSMSSSQQILSDAGSSEYDYMTRSPLLEHEHGSLGPSGLQRIRTLPNQSSPSLTAQKSQRSASNLSLGAMSPHVGPTSPGLEDLHRFPTESLHSFSFAQQSDELIHSRHNILKRSIDFMRDRFGLATSNDAVDQTHERASEDTGIDSVVDLVSKAHLDQTHNTRLRQGPLTGPADLDGHDPFDKAFSQHANKDAPREHSPSNEVAIQETPDSGQYLSPISGPHVATRRKSLKSAPTSRRVSLKRTFTDVGPVPLRERLSEALSQPYSATELTPASGLYISHRTVHTHSSKWSPVAQAVFRTEAKPRWTIIAANDLACLVFGVTQAEVKKLSILDLVQKERREWLESRLGDPSTERQTEQDFTGKQAPFTARSLGMGNGVTAQLLSKPPSRERASRRSQTENGRGASYNRPRQAKSPNHSSNKSRGVLLCGDVVPIQKRNGTTGSASLWVMEKRGGLIWVVEEVVENFARLRFDDDGRLLEAEGDVQSIWERKAVQKGMSISELLPKVTIPHTESSNERDASSKTAKLKYFTASASGDIHLPVTVTELSSPRELRVSHFPHVAGMMVLSPTTLNIISANPVFSATLFGQENPRGSHITHLIPEFDKYLDILTEEDNIQMVDGTVVSEHSFRRARSLSVMKEGKVSAASIFLRPAGLPARHRDGGEIMVDVQMRIVKSETIFPENLRHHVAGQSGSGSDEEGQAVAVTEVVYALWIMYSRQLHSAIQQDSLPPLEAIAQGEGPPPQPSPGQSSPVISLSQAPTQVDLTTTESKAKLSLLSQQLNEAASEPLTDNLAQPVSPVNMSGSKKEVPKKRTISDYVILEEMGQGAYGQVKLARCKRTPSKKVVLKYVTKKRILVDTWTRDRRLGTVPLEIHVLDYLRRDGLRHPNIVEMEGFFEDDINYYIEMRPHGLPGMDLFDYIELQSNMDEGECRSIFLQVVDAIHHLHTKALVVHRDIKDENVVLDGEGQIKLIDFGSAAYIKNGPFDVFVGTIDYAAPEVLQGKPYKGKEQDIWALGILLYTIVYKENPFYNIDEILDHPLRVPYLPFSEDCIDLIRKMLDRDVDQRLTITQVLEHPWMMETTNGMGSE